MVVGKSAVVAGTNDTKTAIYAAHVRSFARPDLRGSSARRDGRRIGNEVREVLQQTMAGRQTRKWVGVHGLEQVDGMVAGIARFNYCVLGQLTLKTEAPGDRK